MASVTDPFALEGGTRGERLTRSESDIDQQKSFIMQQQLQEEQHEQRQLQQQQRQQQQQQQHQSDGEGRVMLLMVDVSRMKRHVQFICLSIAVFVFYLLYGYVQELMFRVEGLKVFGWYVTLVQFAFYSVFGFIELHIITRDTQRRIPLNNYLLLAFLTVATMGLSNSALGYLNYPTAVIFKCCKLIPVLIGGYFIQGKVYGLVDLLACISMSVGLILFILADSTVSPIFSMKGIIFISLALVADAGIGNMQERVMKRYQGVSAEVVLYSYSIGFLYLLAGTTITGELFTATYYCLTNPVSYFYILLFSISGYLGINIVLTLVRTFGALPAVTVTTCRKAVTIILSFIFFTKPFTIQYVWSGMIVVFGIYLNVYAKKARDLNLAHLVTHLAHLVTHLAHLVHLAAHTMRYVVLRQGRSLSRLMFPRQTTLSVEHLV